MEYDRVRIKLAAKAAVRRGSPRPWLVTLVYLLLTQALVSAVSMAVTLPATLAAGANLAIRGHGGHISRGATSAASGLFLAVMVFLYLLAMLFTLVMQTGYLHYTMRLWRGRRTEIKDLFFGFTWPGGSSACPCCSSCSVFCGPWSLWRFWSRFPCWPSGWTASFLRSSSSRPLC